MNNDEVNPDEVATELEEAREFAKTLGIDDVKSGGWFTLLLTKVIQTYDRNANAEYFQKKYPGLPSDDIADKLTSVTIRYATIAGGITGTATTANQITALSSAGMTVGIMLGAIGAEMIYLARLQMKLVLDLSVIYDLQLNPEDPEDILMIFGYALGVAPTELLGKGLQKAATSGTQYAIKKYISKGTLKAIQDFAKKIGLKILQRTIIKYAVPVASAAIGSSYNYATTKSIGKVAKAHFKNRGQVTDELRELVSRQNTYTIAFPAAAMYMAQVDGDFSAKEKEFYKALLSRMSFEEHTQLEFQKLITSEENILEAIKQIEDDSTKNSLVEVLILMAIYDGKLTEEERDFLVNVAAHLNIPLDISKIEAQSTDYQIIAEEGFFVKTAGVAKDATAKVTRAVGQTARNVKGAATTTGGKVSSTFGKVFRRHKDEAQNIEIDNANIPCPSCGDSVPDQFNFCPSCGQSMATEKECLSCNEMISVNFDFCPHCGTSQE